MSVEQKYRSLKILGIVLVIPIVVMLIQAAYIYSIQAELRENGQITTATITIVSTSRNGTVIRVRYMAEGVTYTNRVRMIHTNTYVGEDIQIYYDANNPNRITLVDRTRAMDTFNNLFILPLILLFAGVTYLISLFFYYRHKIIQSKNQT